MIWPEKKFVNQSNKSPARDELNDAEVYREGWNACLEDCKAAYEKEILVERHSCIVCGKVAFTDQKNNGWRCENHVLFGNS